MPQMAPIMWDFMSFLSLIMLLILLAKIYFYLNMSQNSLNNISPMKKNYNINWKW